MYITINNINNLYPSKPIKHLILVIKNIRMNLYCEID